MTEPAPLTVDQEKAFEALLTGNLTRVNDFLKFAETKNAALLTFCSAWLIAIVAFVNAAKPLDFLMELGISLAFVCFALASVTCVYALMPQLSDSQYNKPEEKRIAYFFFDRIADHSQAEFQDLLDRSYRPSESRLFTQQYLRDIVSQMHTVSIIARRKYRLFRLAAAWVAIAVLSVVATVLYKVWLAAN